MTIEEIKKTGFKAIRIHLNEQLNKCTFILTDAEERRGFYGPSTVAYIRFPQTTKEGGVLFSYFEAQDYLMDRFHLSHKEAENLLCGVAYYEKYTREIVIGRTTYTVQNDLKRLGNRLKRAKASEVYLYPY